MSRSSKTSPGVGSRAQALLRIAVVVAVIVHLPYPLAFVWALVTGEQSGNAAGGAALLIAPVMFVISAVIVGPLAWRAWRGGRIAPFALAVFVAFEAWLYRNGTRTESWDEPGSAERLATFQLATHAVALALLVSAAVAVAISVGVGRRRQADGAVPVTSHGGDDGHLLPR